VEGDHTAATIIKAAQEAPLLIIDDLGVEKSTAWAQERGYALLAYRYDNKLETVVTTNVSIETLQPRLWDRLMHQRDDYSKLWDLSGLPSYRSKNMYLGTPTTRTTR
jgi:DNA replication protein DnaC